MLDLGLQTKIGEEGVSLHWTGNIDTGRNALFIKLSCLWTLRISSFNNKCFMKYDNIDGNKALLHPWFYSHPTTPNPPKYVTRFNKSLSIFYTKELNSMNKEFFMSKRICCLHFDPNKLLRKYTFPTLQLQKFSLDDEVDWGPIGEGTFELSWKQNRL